MRKPKPSVVMKVHAPMDRAAAQHGTLTIDRARGIVTVRPSRSREYVVTADVVAAMIVARVIKDEAR